MRYLLAVVTVLLTIPATASASTAALAIADRHWGEHPCAGKTQVIEDPALTPTEVDGLATGVSWIDGVAHLHRCEITIAANLNPTDRCHAIVHEVGHFIHGPEHQGPMHTDNLHIEACDPTLTPRQQLLRSIAEELPGTGWRVGCTPNSRRMRCRAFRASSRYARVYEAEVDRMGATWDLLRLVRR